MYDWVTGSVWHWYSVVYHISPCARWYNPASKGRRCASDYWDRCVFYFPPVNALELGYCTSPFNSFWFFSHSPPMVHKEDTVVVWFPCACIMCVSILSILGNGNWKQDKCLHLDFGGRWDALRATMHGEKKVILLRFIFTVHVKQAKQAQCPGISKLKYLKTPKIGR